MEPPDPILHSLLGAGTRYQGKLFFDGRVRIDGDFRGEVHSDGLLVVGPTAVLHADVHVHTLIVQGGTIEGNIQATELVELHAPARVRGNIRTPTLFVDKGAIFDGDCVMGEIVPLEPAPDSRSADDTSPDGYKDQPTRN
jgi:cytoskeletal protein CcmA (bactofilin family)